MQVCDYYAKYIAGRNFLGKVTIGIPDGLLSVELCQTKFGQMDGMENVCPVFDSLRKAMRTTGTIPLKVS